MVISSPSTPKIVLSSVSIHGSTLAERLREFEQQGLDTHLKVNRTIMHGMSWQR